MLLADLALLRRQDEVPLPAGNTSPISGSSTTEAKVACCGVSADRGPVGGAGGHGLWLAAAQNEILSLGYVTARLAECTFIAIGIVSLLAVVTLRRKAAGADAGSLLTDARSLVAVRDWTFVLGPGFVVGVGNGLILGYLMYGSGLVPRGLAMLGLIGGPLVCISGLAVLLDAIAKGGVAQFIATIPEFLWEL